MKEGAIVLAAVSYRFPEHPFLNVKLRERPHERVAERLRAASTTLVSHR